MLNKQLMEGREGGLCSNSGALKEVLGRRQGDAHVPSHQFKSPCLLLAGGSS